MRPIHPKRILLASMVGTAVEFYDFYIYATAVVLVFNAQFFPGGANGRGLLYALATFSIAFYARFIGAIAFGHFGDRLGRKSTLVASLLIMGGSTMCIGLLPTYASIGFWAPLMLCILRFGQGFGLGGEWGGAALLAVENAPYGWRGRYGTAPQQGSPIGFLLANGLVLAITALITPTGFAAWGWRIPFLASAVMVIIGLWIRLKIVETAEFAQAMNTEGALHVPLFAVVRHALAPLLMGILACISCFAVFYIMTVFSLGWGTKVLHYSFPQFLGLQLLAIPCMAVGVHLSGWLADKHFSAAKILMLGTLLTMITGLLLPFMLVVNNMLLVLLWQALAAFSMGIAYGPLASFLPDLFLVRMRYTGVSMAFNAAAILGGGFTPLLTTYLAQQYGIASVGFYLLGASLLSLWGIVRSAQLADKAAA
jgi:MFS family permease